MNEVFTTDSSSELDMSQDIMMSRIRFSLNPRLRLNLAETEGLRHCAVDKALNFSRRR